MSKKYIYFKCSAEPVSDFLKDQLTELELIALNGGLHPVKTIFQLMDVPDLKLIISKSEALQQLLSADLSQDSIHGYLWSGEYLPEMYKKILFHSVLIDRCFIFQRNTDSPPDISNSPFGRMQQKIEIYNWWIFSWFGLYHLYSRAQQLRRRFESEIEIDKAFKKLFVSGYNPREIVQNKNNSTIVFTDQKKPKPWLSVLLNYCSEPLYIVNLSDTPGLFAALAGKKLHLVQPFSGRNPETEIAAILQEVDVEEYHKAIDSILSSVRLLLSSSGNTQADLFMAPLGKDFISVWQLEKERLKTLPLSLSEANRKAFAVTRFLIERGMAGTSKALTRLLKTAFIHTIVQLLKKQGSQDFISQFQKALRALYSDLYVIDKLRPLIPTNAKNWVCTEVLEEASLDKARSVLFQPQDGYAPKKSKTEIQLSRLFGSDKIEMAPAGFDEETIWHDEIGMQSPRLRKTGRAGKYLFNRLYTQNLKKEATTLFWHWQQVDRFLQETEAVTSPGSKICLILPTLQINERSVSIREIIVEQINSIPSRYTYSIVKDFTPGDGVDLLILIKKKEGQDV